LVNVAGFWFQVMQRRGRVIRLTRKQRTLSHTSFEEIYFSHYLKCQGLEKF
jgi:hypothetical protein